MSDRLTVLVDMKNARPSRHAPDVLTIVPGINERGWM